MTTTERPTKHVILKYNKPLHTINLSSPTSISSASPTSTISSATSSPGSNSPISTKANYFPEEIKDPLDVQTSAAFGHIEKLYTYTLDEDDEWKESANKVLEILEPLRLRWKELEVNRKALAKSAAASARASKGAVGATTTATPGVVKRGPGRPTGWRKRPVIPPPSVSSGTSSGGEGAQR